MTASSKNQNDSRAQEFYRILEKTNEDVSRLLEDLQENEVNFATLKAQLAGLMVKVQELSALVRENESELSSLATQVTILERTVADLNLMLRQSNSDRVLENNGRWSVIAATVTGGLALVTAIIGMLINLLAK